MSRPSDYSQELADLICERLTQGESLRGICADEEMPHAGTVCRWLARHVEFREQYTLAREAQAELHADEMIEIADNGSNDWMKKNFGEDTRWVENGEALRRSALRIDTRKWVAAKLLPKKYGEKIAVGGSKDMDPIETKDMSANDLGRRIAFALAQAVKSGSD